MLLRANGKVYAVHVFYDQPITEQKRFYAPTLKRRGTYVRMHEGTCNALTARDCTVPSVQAMAECSEKDQFERRKGRKIALGRAMPLLIKDPLERKELWDDFRRAIKEIPDVQIVPVALAVQADEVESGSIGY